MMKNESVKDWQEIQRMYDEMQKMSCKPSFLRVPGDYVFDENRSVKWNREQVAENHRKYDQEVARLNTQRNKRRDEILEEIYKRIQAEVGSGFSRESAKAVWLYACKEWSSCNIRDILCYLQRLLELLRTITGKK